MTSIPVAPQGWRHWHLLLALTTLLLIGLKGWNQLGIPFPLDSDAYVFLPQAIHYRLDGHLINTVYSQTIGYSPEHDGRYIWHGYLFPLITAYLMPRADYPSAALVVFGYEVITLVTMAFALATLRPRDAVAAWTMVLPLFVCAAWLDIGRPEPLIFVWFSLGLLAFLHTRSTWHPWIVGLTLGLTSATSLVPGAFFGLFYAAYLALWKTRRDCIENGIKAAWTGVMVFALTLFIYPYTFLEWCHGTSLHATVCMLQHHLKITGFIYGWITNTVYPLALFWLGLFGAVLFFYASKIDWRRRGWRFGFVVFSLIILVAIVRTSGDERLYNIVCLGPLFLFATQAMLWSMAETWTAARRKTAALVLAIFALITMVPQLDYGLLRFQIHRGLDRAHAQVLVDKIMQDEPGAIDFSLGLVSLFNQPRGGGINSGFYLSVPELPSQAPIVLIQQINPYQVTPPIFSNYTLVQNYFTDYVPRFLGFRLAQSPRAYNFAVYKRNALTP
jgi:hypothetical protein